MYAKCADVIMIGSESITGMWKEKQYGGCLFPWEAASLPLHNLHGQCRHSTHKRSSQTDRFNLHTRPRLSHVCLPPPTTSAASPRNLRLCCWPLPYHQIPSQPSNLTDVLIRRSVVCHCHYVISKKRVNKLPGKARENGACLNHGRKGGAIRRLTFQRPLKTYFV
jgi:hypothetical protein